MPSSGFQTCALDRKSTRLNSSHTIISYAVFCLKKKMTFSSAAILLSSNTDPPGLLLRFFYIHDTPPYINPILPHYNVNFFFLAPLFFFYVYGFHRNLHFFPTRRSSD